jgi:RecJ-like exonuclease
MVINNKEEFLKFSGPIVDVCGRCCVIEEFPLCGGGSTYRIDEIYSAWSVVKEQLSAQWARVDVVDATSQRVECGEGAVFGSVDVLSQRAECSEGAEIHKYECCRNARMAHDNDTGPEFVFEGCRTSSNVKCLHKRHRKAKGATRYCAAVLLCPLSELNFRPPLPLYNFRIPRPPRFYA